MAVLLATGIAAAPAAQALDVQAFIKKEAFNEIKLSPNGDYFAATVPLEDRTVLVVLRRSDNKLTANFGTGKNTHVSGFVWVNHERLIISTEEKIGALNQPVPVGELYAINADGSQAELLIGQRVKSQGLQTRIQPKKIEQVAAHLVDGLSGDDKNVVISVEPFVIDAFARAERMDAYTGRRATLA